MKVSSDSIHSKKVQIKNILVPVDGSENSLKAAEYATRIAKCEKAKLYCIHVITPHIPYGYTTPAVSSGGQRYKDIKRIVESWFDKVRAIVKKEGVQDVKTEIFADVKSVVGSIVDYATSKDIDLIVIGTRGKTGLKRFLMGSVANGIIKHA